MSATIDFDLTSLALSEFNLNKYDLNECDLTERDLSNINLKVLNSMVEVLYKYKGELLEEQNEYIRNQNKEKAKYLKKQQIERREFHNLKYHCQNLMQIQENENARYNDLKDAHIKLLQKYYSLNQTHKESTQELLELKRVLSELQEQTESDHEIEKDNCSIKEEGEKK